MCKLGVKSGFREFEEGDLENLKCVGDPKGLRWWWNQKVWDWWGCRGLEMGGSPEGLR